VSLRLKVELHLGAPKSAEETLDVARIRFGAEHESGHERPVEIASAPATMLLDQVRGRAHTVAGISPASNASTRS
jgi:hypothetical protein